MGRFSCSTSEKIESAKKMVGASLHLARKKLYDRGLRSGIFASFHDVYDVELVQRAVKVVGSVKVVWKVRTHHDTSMLPPFIAVPVLLDPKVVQHCVPVCGDWRAITDSHRMILINTNAIWSSVECEAIKCEVNVARPKQSGNYRFATFLGNGGKGVDVINSSFSFSDDPRILSRMIQGADLVHIGAFPNILSTEQRAILVESSANMQVHLPQTSVNSFWISQTEEKPPTITKEQFVYRTSGFKTDGVCLPPNFSFDELWSEI